MMRKQRTDLEANKNILPPSSSLAAQTNKRLKIAKDKFFQLSSYITRQSFLIVNLKKQK